MKKNYVFIVVWIITAWFTVFNTQSAKAQGIIYYQNFDDTFALPTGWTTEFVGDTNGNVWCADSANPSYTPNGNGGYAGASGKYSLYVDNSWHQGQYILFSSLIIASNFKNIVVQWGARTTTNFGVDGSRIAGFWWSGDGGNNWDSIPYTENPQDGYWHLENNGTQITLPTSADYHGLYFDWVVNTMNAPSGSYQIDDFTVSGTSITAVEDIKDKPSALVYVINNSTINIVAKDMAGQQLTVELVDMVGNTLRKEIMTSETYGMNVASLASGVYLVRVSNSAASEVTKVVLNR